VADGGGTVGSAGAGWLSPLDAGGSGAAGVGGTAVSAASAAAVSGLDGISAAGVSAGGAGVVSVDLVSTGCSAGVLDGGVSGMNVPLLRIFTIIIPYAAYAATVPLWSDRLGVMDILNTLQQAVSKQFDQGHAVAHDVKHVLRVVALAKYIARQEGYDEQEAAVAGLLHDMGRSVQDEDKGHGPAGVPLARQLLDECTDYDAATKQRILDVVGHHSELNTTGRLMHIVQDADRLDGLGAVGLARAYTSKAMLSDYDPANIMPSEGRRDTTIHDQIAFQMEFMGFMETATGKRIATKRHAFMVRFLEEFRDEVGRRDLG
jgi:uncharacterized protein